MSESGTPVGKSPVKVALLRMVGEVNTKSSADSISIFPAELGREAVAMSPSGFPVLKKKEPASACDPLTTIAPSATIVARCQIMRRHLSGPLIAQNPIQFRTRIPMAKQLGLS